MIVITALEQELGTELDLVPTHHHLAMERKCIAICYNKPSIQKKAITIIFEALVDKSFIIWIKID